MKSGNMTGGRACMQVQPARIMGSMRARTVSARVRGVLRRHVVGSAALAAAQREPAQRHATAHQKSRKVCAGSDCRRDPIDTNEFCARGNIKVCSQECASCCWHQASHVMYRVRARKVCRSRCHLTFADREHRGQKALSRRHGQLHGLIWPDCRPKPPSRGRPA